MIYVHDEEKDLLNSQPIPKSRPHSRAVGGGVCCEDLGDNYNIIVHYSTTSYIYVCRHFDGSVSATDVLWNICVDGLVSCQAECW